jgi:hypothetical protein
MSSLADMRKELREMRKESVKPVSRMKKGDISAEIERMRNKRETTPSAAAVPSASPKKLASRVESIKEAKAKEFPVAPAKEEKKSKAVMKEPSEKKKKGVSKAELMKMISGMSSDSE